MTSRRSSGKSPAAARQLASRARRRVQGTPEPPETDAGRQKEIVTAFLAASRGGDFEALLEMLDPGWCYGPTKRPWRAVRTCWCVARPAVAESFSGRAQAAKLTLVNGLAGAVWSLRGEPQVVFNFTIADGRITSIELLGNPDYLREVELAPVNG